MMLLDSVLHDEKDVSHPVRPGAFDKSLRQQGCLTLSVKDSGAGMSEDNLKVKVFSVMCSDLVM